MKCVSETVDFSGKSTNLILNLYLLFFVLGSGEGVAAATVEEFPGASGAKGFNIPFGQLLAPILDDGIRKMKPDFGENKENLRAC